MGWGGERSEKCAFRKIKEEGRKETGKKLRRRRAKSGKKWIAKFRWKLSDGRGMKTAGRKSLEQV